MTYEELDKRGIPINFKMICFLCDRIKDRNIETREPWILITTKKSHNTFLALCSSHKLNRKHIINTIYYKRQINSILNRNNQID